MTKDERNQWVEDNLNFIHYSVSRMYPRIKHQDYEDYFQEATYAALYALTMFDDTRGIKPTTYVYRAIYTKLLNYHARQRLIPVRPDHIQYAKELGIYPAVDFYDDVSYGFDPDKYTFLDAVPASKYEDMQCDDYNYVDIAYYLSHQLTDLQYNIVIDKMHGLTETDIMKHEKITRSQYVYALKVICDKAKTIFKQDFY